MANTVKTQQTSKSTSDILVNYVIDQTETTRKIMRARVVDNPKDADACISCVILHQRKGRNEQWEDCEAINLQTLKAGEGVKLHLGCSETKALLSSLEQAYSVGRQGVQRGISRFVVANSDDMVIPAGAEARYIKLLIEQGLSEDIWKQLVDTNPDLATKLSLAKIQTDRIAIVDEFTAHLNRDDTEKFWQCFLSSNDWIFGFCLSYHFTTMVDREVYVGGTNVNGRNGELCDFMAMSEGNAKYTSLVEIKRPTTPLLCSRPPRGTTYGVSRELSDAVAQVQTYCNTWGTNTTRESFNFQVKNNSVTVLPKGILVIGNTAELDSEDKIRSFELFRRNLHNPEIITYDELFARAKFVAKYDECSKELPSKYSFNIDDLPF